MGFSARVLADSVSRAGHRLVTLEVTIPRIVLAEFNTHRMLSRNSASSRAIPVEKRIAAVEADPFYPAAFGRNQRGMQAAEELKDDEARAARGCWTAALDAAIREARELSRLGVHKQLANRLLEPFLWHTIIVSATEWSNFDALRCHEAAQPEIRTPAEMMRGCRDKSSPVELSYGHWHMPLVDGHEIDAPLVGATIERWKQISVGRCARVSVLTHDGRHDPDEDVALCGRMRAGGHMSPYEHVARPMTPEERKIYRRIELTFDDGTNQSVPVTPSNELRRVGDTWPIYTRGQLTTKTITAIRDTYFCGNFNGWVQYRKELPFEHDFAQIPKS